MLTIETVTTEDDFRRLEPVWNKLLVQSDADMPFLTFEWMTAWWESFKRDDDEFGRQKRLHILVVKENDDVVAIAPLMRTTRRVLGMPMTVLCNMVNHHSFRAGLIVAPDHAAAVQALATHLTRADEPWDLLHLSYLPEESASYARLREAFAAGPHLVAETVLARSPYLPITSDWSAYFSSKTSKVRNDITRKLRRLDRHHAVQIIKFSDAGQDDLLRDLLSVDCHTWQHRNGTAIVSQPSTEQFYTHLAQLATLKGWLHGHLLKVDGAPIAYEYNLRYNDVLYNLKIGHDLRASHLGPGIALKYHVLKNAFDSQCSEFDFLGWDDDFKMMWTDATRKHVNLIVCRRDRLKTRLYHAYQFRLKPAVKQWLGVARLAHTARTLRHQRMGVRDA